ncbi:ATP synthase subunit d, mitochondrial-like [Macrosteles quadrilineatus]|uniref:ATP synthase subunit d, mitochondrial-like n=1 Tax=Macrosteles quadrilineatus TaxID=74068 RepID=UPI0023E2C2E3|nr:ATP synthase subunit d, mitochondrial-like [Macrosteles quadrilineatus]
MAAKRIASSSINWAAIAERVPAEQKAQFLAFKSKSDNIVRKVVALPENPPKIDWAYYKSKIPVPAMVDEFQKKYESFKIPLPEDNITATIATEEKAAAENVKNFKAESQKRFTQLETELKKYENQIPFIEMTMEEVAYYYPDQAIDTTNKPTFWPHDPELDARLAAENDKGGHH